MKVPAQCVTVGMVTEHNGTVTSIDHTETDTPVVIEGTEGLSLHATYDMVEVVDNVFRVQYWDHAWGGFRDIKGLKTFTSHLSWAEATVRDLLEHSIAPRKYRILRADGTAINYRRNSFGRIIKTGA